jgi:hypothetical protein
VIRLLRLDVCVACIGWIRSGAGFRRARKQHSESHVH